MPTPPTQETIDDLNLELIQLRKKMAIAKHSPSLPGSSTGLYVWSVVILSVGCIAGIVGIQLAHPEKDNTPIITMIIGFLATTAFPLLGKALQEVHIAFNSRMTELLALTEKSALAEGKLAEKNAIAAGLPVPPIVDATVRVVP